MRFMVAIRANTTTEAGGPMPSTELLEAMGKFNEEMVKAGVMLSAEGLHPSSKGALVKFSGGKHRVIDGPFAEAKELIAGYSIIEAASLAEVIEMVKDWPQSDGHGNAQIEIRQIATAESLGFDEEQQERYNKIVAQQQQ